jgi:parallel beta-helix repeat protein
MPRFRVLAVLFGSFLIASCNTDQTTDTLAPESPESPRDPVVALSLLPDSASVGVDEQIQFELSNAVENESGELEWSATGGRIDTEGGFSAGAPGRYTVYAKRKGWQETEDSAVVVVRSHRVRIVRVAPDARWVTPKSVARFKAVAVRRDGSTRELRKVRWSATGGSIDENGRFLASSRAGRYQVVARLYGESADTANVVVDQAASKWKIRRVVLSPADTTLAPGSSYPFSVVARVRGGRNAPVDVRYSATGGSVSSNGVYTAGMTPGHYRLIARAENGMADTARITIAGSPEPEEPGPQEPDPEEPAPPDATQLSLRPDSVALAPAGTQRFAVTARTSSGTSTTLEVTYSVTGGTITSDGLYTAGKTAGNYHVVATAANGLADTSVVTITGETTPAPPADPTLQRIDVTPSSASLRTGATQRYTVVGRMSDGSSDTVSAQFTATGGTMSENGLYTAGGTAGNYRVIATVNRLADTATVTITSTSQSCTSSSTRACPGDDLQAKLNAGVSTLTLAPGVYRMQALSPRSGQTIQGEPGAILSGAKELTGWQSSGAAWYVGGQTHGQTQGSGSCLAGWERCRYGVDVFIDDVVQRHVSSLSSVGPGSWYYDFNADRIYIGTNPAGKLVETSVISTGLQGSGSNVTIKNLVVEKYSETGVRPGDSWTFDGVTIEQNHFTGLRGGQRNLKFLRSKLLANGQMGIGGWGQTDMLLEDCEIGWNNTARYDDGWESGGTKFAGTNRVTVRNCYVHHNYGPGLWNDIDNFNTVFEGNTIEDNGAYGIQHEISFNAIFRNNVIRRNGGGAGYDRCGGQAACAGIAIQNSRDVEVYGNTLTDNWGGIVLLEQNRGSSDYGHGEWHTRNVWVHDNIVTQSRSGSNAAGLSNQASGTEAFDGNNRFDRNTYTLKGTGTYFLWEAGRRTDSQWRSDGMDVSGTIRRQ